MNWTLLHKYLSGECNPEEMQKVEDWLQADEGNLRFFDSLQKIWNVDPDEEIAVDAQSAWSAFQQKISPAEEAAEKKALLYKAGRLRKKQSPRKTYKYTAAIALSAAAVILLAMLFSWRFAPDTGESLQPRFTMQEIVTGKGQRTTFLLSDGTRVQLNADSKIEIPKTFRDSSRKVYLQGEAYFEVSHDPQRPFWVYAGEAHTKVLGTKFGVRAYPEEEQIHVVVAEGKVALGAGKDSIGQSAKEVGRNQIGVFTRQGQTRVSDADDIRQHLGWKDGQLIFEDTPFGQVRPRLERWFDIVCTIADTSLDHRRITAAFDGEPMTEVLNVVALSMDMSYEREGRTVIFRKNRLD